MKGILVKIAHIKVSLASVCHCILFFVGLIFVLIIVNDILATKVLTYFLSFILSFCVFYTIYCFVFSKDSKDKDKKDHNS